MSEIQEGGIGFTYDSDDHDVAEPEVLAVVAEELELATDSPDAVSYILLTLLTLYCLPILCVACSVS